MEFSHPLGFEWALLLHECFILHTITKAIANLVIPLSEHCCYGLLIMKSCSLSKLLWDGVVGIVILFFSRPLFIWHQTRDRSEMIKKSSIINNCEVVIFHMITIYFKYVKILYWSYANPTHLRRLLHNLFEKKLIHECLVGTRTRFTNW